jgi:hypothetical protein
MHKVLRQNFQYYISYMGKGYCRPKKTSTGGKLFNPVIFLLHIFWPILHIFQFFAEYYYMSFVNGSLCMCDQEVKSHAEYQVVG